jgi:hypothetical protein
MPIEQVPGTDLHYHLIAFDGDGREREDDPDGRMSERAIDVLKSEPISDVFLMSHGWRADVPSARSQYAAWIGAMLACTDDIARIKQARAEFRPLLIGLHWPSEPFGDEELGDGTVSFGGDDSPATALVDRFAARLADTPAARSALETIVTAMIDDPAPATLPAGVRDAYTTLARESGVALDPTAEQPIALRDEGEPFDAEAIYQAGRGDPLSYGDTAGGLFLLPLRLLSYRKMKDRAKRIGETGGAQLLNAMQNAVGEQRGTRFHLMGHSFGCIVVSAAVAGTADDVEFVRPVNSMVLVQGAMSIWSYAKTLPDAPDRTGAFHRIISRERVAGPILTTMSALDSAVADHYPRSSLLGAWVPGASDQLSFAPGQTEFPKYAAIGALGLRGDGLLIQDLELKAASDPYDFEPGWIYNLQSVQVIKEGGPPSGAHGDFLKNEVGHAVWEAAAGGEILAFNGVNCSRGVYLQPPRTAREISALARQEEWPEAEVSELTWKHESGQETFAVPVDVDQRDLAQTGWGIVFAHDADPAIREALAPLLDHRRAQASAENAARYREFIGPDAYRPNETRDEFLLRFGSAVGQPVDPDKLPFYLLLVGSPEMIPFEFQQQLDVEHAVGRIDFETAEEYARYAQGVVAAETAQTGPPPRAVFFGVQNPADEATSRSANGLVAPLAQEVTANHANWQIEVILREEATKARLKELLGGPDTPAFLFTASHGAFFDKDDPLQIKHQGALLCQDWPGPFAWEAGKAVPQDHYFAGDDLGDEAKVGGLIAFHFACYGAGTPQYDQFAHRLRGQTERPPIAPRPFVAALPKRLLGHPNGTALAVVGHVERAWDCSFFWRGRNQLSTFESTLRLLLKGYPVGAATEPFNNLYASLSTSLTRQLEEAKYGRALNDLEMSSLWTANNDARGYAIIGDPAVRLAAATTAPGPAPGN